MHQGRCIVCGVELKADRKYLVTMNTAQAVEDFLAGCRARGLSPQTVRWYRYMLGAFAHKFPELPQEPGQVEHFLGEPEISDELRHGRFRALRAFYYWLQFREGLLNPMAVICAPKRKKKRPRTLSLADMGCLLLAPLSKRDRAMITTLIDTGVRIGELVGLDREDVGDETIFVTGKTGQREVPISAEARRQLLDLASSGPLFLGDRGRLTTSGAYQALRKALIRSGLSGAKLGPHLLRHTFGRQYIMAGGDLVSLQRILGHADITTTRIYAELNLADDIAQHQRFTPLKWAASAAQGQLWGIPAEVSK